MDQSASNNELLQCFDGNGIPTETRTRAEVMALSRLYWFAVARVWLVNDKGQIMCSKRAQSLSIHGGKWQTFFGGHVCVGRTIKETAQIELEEEAGIVRSLSDFFLIEKNRVDKSKLFFESYAVRFNGAISDLKFMDGEITQAKWMGMDKYWEERNLYPELWSNDCTLENQRDINKWLISLLESSS